MFLKSKVPFLVEMCLIVVKKMPIKLLMCLERNVLRSRLDDV